MNLRNHATTLVAAAIFALVCGVFWQTGGFDYISFDDQVYVSRNGHVAQGLTREGLSYAFAGTRDKLAIWFPLTMLSYMLDAEVGGMAPRVFHLSSVIWHGLASVALFLLIAEWVTVGAGRGRGSVRPRLRGPELLIAAAATLLWALHPQRIESVAWIASRKDLVSGLFAFLALVFYLRGVRLAETDRLRCGGAAARQRLSGPVLASYASYALAIMGKPVVMTLPLAMGCLEWVAWRTISWKKLAVPCAMGLACAALAITMQAEVGVKVGATYKEWARLVTSFASVAYYFAASVWPQRIAIIHPWALRPEWYAAAAGLALCAGAGGLLLLRKGLAADLAALALLFIAALGPMLNVFVFGVHSRADRFTYYPALAWSVGVAALWARQREEGPARGPGAAGGGAWRKTALAGLALLGAACYGRLTLRELPHWRDSEAVFARAVAQEPDNAPALYHLAVARYEAGRDPAEVIQALRESVKLAPDLANLGMLAYMLACSAEEAGLPEARGYAEAALNIHAGDGTALAALGYLAMRKGDWAAAADCFERANESGDRVDLGVLTALGIAQHNLGRKREAAATFRRALEQRPGDATLSAFLRQAEEGALREQAPSAPAARSGGAGKPLTPR